MDITVCYNCIRRGKYKNQPLALVQLCRNHIKDKLSFFHLFRAARINTSNDCGSIYW